MPSPSRRLLTWSLVVALAVAGTLGCDSKDEPKSPLKSGGRYELQPEQASILGEELTSLPDDGLVDQSGEAFSFEEIAGKPLVLSTMYTSCPMPDMCPLLTTKLGKVQQRLREESDAEPDAYRFVLVSVDPKNDTPEKMRNYVTERGWELDNAVLITGEPATIERLTEKLGVAAERVEEGTFNHNIRTFLVGSDGTFRHAFRTPKWEVDELFERFFGLVD